MRPPEDYYALASYEAMANEIFKHQNYNVGLTNFRLLYSSIQRYQPLADETKDELYKAAFQATNGATPQEQEDGKARFTLITYEHLANIAILATAIDLTKQYPELGDVRFYQMTYDNIFENILESGDGKTINSAYQVISFDEETEILRAKNLKIIDQIIAEPDIGRMTNIYQMQNIRNGKIEPVHINVRIPLRYIEKQRHLMEQDLQKKKKPVLRF